MRDVPLFEKMAQFNHERVSKCVLHAKGAGACGAFTVTADISHYSRAKSFDKVGNSCETFARCFAVAGELGRVDTVGDPRGFALKCYTEDRNGGGSPVYEPDSIGGPVEDPTYREPPLRIDGDADRYSYRDGNDDYPPAGDLYRYDGCG